jgi:hypothetical protein
MTTIHRRPPSRRLPLAGLAVATLAVAALAARVWTTSPAPAGAAQPPARLADTGLYADFASRTLADGVLPYSPQYPLWTDGATKERWIRLPRGTWIDASDPDAWVFPIGTKLWKEFSFGRRVETRFLERGADGRWSYATYAWNADGSDAVLAPANGVRGACESRPGVRFDIPSRLDCLACHQGGASEVLGFGALQLAHDRDPLAPHAEPREAGDVDLDALLARGLVRGLPSHLRAPRIAAADAQARAALGYLHANCGICHNARGPLASLDLRFDVALGDGAGAPPVLATALGQASRWQRPGTEATVRIAAGQPDRSLLVARLGSRDPLLQMPPLGTHVVDEQALELITAWIRGLPPRAGAATTDPVPTKEKS